MQRYSKALAGQSTSALSVQVGWMFPPARCAQGFLSSDLAAVAELGAMAMAPTTDFVIPARARDYKHLRVVRRKAKVPGAMAGLCTAP